QSNILISSCGVPCIADFGLSRSQETSTAAPNTSRKGTLRWMARELFDHECAAPTQKSDVWAFGMTMLELDSGCYPYLTLADPAVVNAILDGVLPSVPDNVYTRLRCLRAAREICELCWKFPPEERPSMNYVLERVQELKTCEENIRLSTLRRRCSTEGSLGILHIGT
ncbi:kinase-like protein, partial [Gyrodon lividus]